MPVIKADVQPYTLPVPHMIGLGLGDTAGSMFMIGPGLEDAAGSIVHCSALRCFMGHVLRPIHTVVYP